HVLAQHHFSHPAAGRPAAGRPSQVIPAAAAGSVFGVGLDIGPDRGRARLDGGADDIVQAVLGLPAQRAGDALPGADQPGRVPGAGLTDLGRDLDALGAGDRVDHLEHAGPLAGADVEGAVRALLTAQVVQGGDVGMGEVEHVDVVADAGSV